MKLCFICFNYAFILFDWFLTDHNAINEDINKKFMRHKSIFCKWNLMQFFEHEIQAKDLFVSRIILQARNNDKTYDCKETKNFLFLS